MAIEAKKYLTPLIYKGKYCTFPTFASQVFFDDGMALEGNVLTGDPNETSGDTPELSSMPTNSDRLGGMTYQQIIDMIYPRGRIISTLENEDDPNTLYPWQTWEQIAKGRTLIGEGSNEANTDTTYGSLAAGTVNRALGEMGGENKHKVTVSEMPSHRHDFREALSSGSSTGYRFSAENGTYGPSSVYMDYTGGGQAHNNMPPYLIVKFWKRVS